MNAWQSIEAALGIGTQPGDLDFLQISLRGVVMFFAALIMVRLADKRSFAKHTAFDIILGLMIASTLSRGINGSAPFFPTIGLGFVLVWLHRLLAWIACRHHDFGMLIKGTDDILVKDGRINRGSLLKHHLSEHDLYEGLRIGGNVGSIDDVEVARIERNGAISVVHRKAS